MGLFHFQYGDVLLCLATRWRALVLYRTALQQTAGLNLLHRVGSVSLTFLHHWSAPLLNSVEGTKSEILFSHAF